MTNSNAPSFPIGQNILFMVKPHSDYWTLEFPRDLKPKKVFQNCGFENWDNFCWFRNRKKYNIFSFPNGKNNSHQINCCLFNFIWILDKKSCSKTIPKLFETGLPYTSFWLLNLGISKGFMAKKSFSKLWFWKLR